MKAVVLLCLVALLMGHDCVGITPFLCDTSCQCLKLHDVAYMMLLNTGVFHDVVEHGRVP